MDITGQWSVSGTTNDNFQVTGSAIINNDGTYSLSLNQAGTSLSESGTYQLNGSNLIFHSDTTGKETDWQVSNFQGDSFDLTSANQHYLFQRQ